MLYLRRRAAAWQAAVLARPRRAPRAGTGAGARRLRRARGLAGPAVAGLRVRQRLRRGGRHRPPGAAGDPRREGLDAGAVHRAWPTRPGTTTRTGSAPQLHLLYEGAVVALTAGDQPDAVGHARAAAERGCSGPADGSAAATVVASARPLRAPRRPRRGRRRPRARSRASSTSAGTSSRSGSLRCGRNTSVSPARWAASSFCFSAADRQHPAVEGDLAGHPDLGAHRAPGRQRDQRGHHRDARRRAVLGHRARRARARGSPGRGTPGRRRARPRARARRTARSAPTPSSRRRAGRSG